MYLDTLATTVATQCYHLLHYNLTKITPELLVNLIYNVQLFYKMVPFHNRELQLSPLEMQALYNMYEKWFKH